MSVSAAAGRLTSSLVKQYPIGDLLSIRIPLALLLTLPAFAPILLPSSRLLSLAVVVAIYVIVANGLHVIFSYTGQLSLAHATLWGAGAYTAALLVIHYDVPTIGLLPAAGLAGAVGAVAIGLPAFRTAGFSFAIITFAFAEILRLIANNWTGLTNGSLGLTVVSAPSSLGPIEFDTFDNLANFYHLTLGMAYLSLVALWVIRQSSLGKSFIAIRENEVLARSVGMNVYVHKLVAFAISGFFAGVAGVLLMYHQKHIEPGPLSPFGAFFTIQFLLMILLGGRFSMLGPTIGAVIVVFGPEVVNAVFGDVLDPARIQVIFGGSVVFAVLFAPHGVAGQARRGYRTFFQVLQYARGRGRSWPVAFGVAFACSVVPAIMPEGARMATSEERAR